jgi:hypothetical protein
MRDPDRVIDIAARASTRIPDQSDSMPHLIEAYRESALAGFHDWFYSEEHHTPEEWPETYDRTPLEPLPPCARHILEHPNDLLLRPGGIERIVRVMLSLGWHPRHIAGLIRSKFERDHAWGEQWTGYDPATRADFYTRIFAGLFVTGHDDLVDFNWQSAIKGSVNEIVMFPSPGSGRRMPYENMTISLTDPLYGTFCYGAQQSRKR